MFTRRIHFASRQTSAPPLRRAYAVARWRVWTALLTALTFVVLVSTAAMHHHATTAEDQDCAVCSVITHKITDVPLVILPRLVVVLVSYAPFLLAAPAIAPASPLLLPPGCGPPDGSSAIC
jgi:hypothetical protein